MWMWIQILKIVRRTTGGRYYFIAPQQAKRAVGHTKPMQACEYHFRMQKYPLRRQGPPGRYLPENVSYGKQSYTKELE